MLPAASLWIVKSYEALEETALYWTIYVSISDVLNIVSISEKSSLKIALQQNPMQDSSSLKRGRGGVFLSASHYASVAVSSWVFNSKSSVVGYIRAKHGIKISSIARTKNIIKHKFVKQKLA